MPDPKTEDHDMNNPTLIASLCADLTPVEQTCVERQIAVAGLIGGGVSLAALISTLGIQPGLSMIANMTPFAIKAGFAVSVAAVGFAGLLKSARPDGRPTQLPQKLAPIIVLLASWYKAGMSIMRTMQSCCWVRLGNPVRCGSQLCRSP